MFRELFSVVESQRSNNAKNILDLKNHSDVYIFKFGKYKGMPMKKVCSQHGEKTVIGYIRWCLKNIKLFENDIKYFNLIDATNKILISKDNKHKSLDYFTCDAFLFNHGINMHNIPYIPELNELHRLYFKYEMYNNYCKKYIDHKAKSTAFYILKEDYKVPVDLRNII